MIQRTFFPVGRDQKKPDLKYLKKALEERGRRVVLSFIPHKRGSHWKGTVEIAEEKGGWR
jgi:hypothetical protein